MGFVVGFDLGDEMSTNPILDVSQGGQSVDMALVGTILILQQQQTGN